MKRDVGYYELNVFFTMPLADTEIENELQITITATVSFMDVENGPRWGMTCKKPNILESFMVVASELH